MEDGGERGRVEGRCRHWGACCIHDKETCFKGPVPQGGTQVVKSFGPGLTALPCLLHPCWQEKGALAGWNVTVMLRLSLRLQRNQEDDRDCTTMPSRVWAKSCVANGRVIISQFIGLLEMGVFHICIPPRNSGWVVHVVPSLLSSSQQPCEVG